MCTVLMNTTGSMGALAVSWHAASTPSTHARRKLDSSEFLFKGGSRKGTVAVKGGIFNKRCDTDANPEAEPLA